MSIFINRTAELDFLNKKYASNSAELIILYGRRRIGKTEIIQHFCKGKECIYFMGRLESKEDTIKRFNNLLVELFNDNKLLVSQLQNWDGIFDYLSEKSEKRVVLAIDEFPFIVDRFPEIISIIQDKWDSKLKNSKIMIILSGSSVGMMEKYALDYKSPLYGRRTGQWKVDKMSVLHLSEFFPSYSAEDIVKVYSCLDMIPGYLDKFSTRLSFEENIKERLFSKGEFLYEEIEILLREELRDPSNYMSILSGIAGGLATFNEIFTRTGLDKSLLSKYLGVLENIGIIERVSPVNESYKSRLKSKLALYSLKDNFFDFWFRFVYLNKQEIEKGNKDYVLKSMKKEIEHFVSRKFESFIKEIFWLGEFGKFSNTGRWWHKDKEIDIVALNEDKSDILFGECKWQTDVNPLSVLNVLVEKSAYVGWHKGKRKEIYALFAKSFSKKVREFEGRKVICYDLKDIEKMLRK